MPEKTSRRVVVLGDLHFPFASKKALAAVYREIASDAPTTVIQVGDLYDMYSFSRYPVNPNVTTPESEIERGFKGAAEMWATVRRLAPKARCIQLLGNHDARPSKRLSESLPAVKSLAKKGLEGLFTFPGVETVMDDTQELFEGGVCFMHGHRSKLGDHARYNQMRTVCGHSHTGGVVYLRQRNRVFWELNAGWMGDESAPVFRYGNQKILRTWTLGYGVIDARGPRFVAL